MSFCSGVRRQCTDVSEMCALSVNYVNVIQDISDSSVCRRLELTVLTLPYLTLPYLTGKACYRLALWPPVGPMRLYLTLPYLNLPYLTLRGRRVTA